MALSMHIKLLLALCIIKNVICANTWVRDSSLIDMSIRSQRDVSQPIPIDQLTSVGFSLNTMLFNKDGYTLSALDDLKSYLDIGAQTLVVELYWNEFTQKWQLCPAPFPRNSTSNLDVAETLEWKGNTYKCQALLTTSLLMQTIYSFLSETNSNLDVNIIELLFKLKTILAETTTNRTNTLQDIYTSTNTSFNSLGNSTLSDTISSFGNLVFTPKDLDNYRVRQSQNSKYNTFYNQSSNTLPSLETFLFVDFKRVLVNVISNDVVNSSLSYNFTNADRDQIFFSNSNLRTTIQSTSNTSVYDKCVESLNNRKENVTALNEISLTTNFEYIVDHENKPFTNSTYRDYIRCGISPIFNSSHYIVNNDGNDTNTTENSEIIENFVPLSFWSWAPGQPNTGDNSANFNMNVTEISKSNAFKCVALFADGWHVVDCYSRYHYACQKNGSPHEWIVNDDEKSYFDSFSDPDCPEGYDFTLPRLSLESLSLKDAIEENNRSYPVWIDLNDITVTNCFVSGGPYAQCPYQRTVTRSKLVRLIAPSFLVALFIVVAIFVDKIFTKHPIQTNRKRYWKRIINEYNEKNEYEGVPS